MRDVEQRTMWVGLMPILMVYVLMVLVATLCGGVGGSVGVCSSDLVYMYD